MKKQISTNQAPAAIGPYSQAIQCGDMVYLSGQIPLDPQSGNIVSGDTADQAHQVMKNIAAVLESANCNFDNVIKSTIFLKDLKDFQEINEIYQSYLTPPYPARSTVEVARLPKDVRVEIEIIAKVF